MSYESLCRLLSAERVADDPCSSTAVCKYLLENNLIDGNIMTVTGKTLGENLDKAPDMKEGQDVIRPLHNPIKSTGHLRRVLVSRSRSLSLTLSSPLTAFSAVTSLPVDV